MLEKFFYYAVTFAEAGLAFAGVRGLFEQPAYTVRQDLGQHLEIRDYAPAKAAEASVREATWEKGMDAAFRLMFAYITGRNTGGAMIAMTVPVQQIPAPSLIAMTSPVHTDIAAENGAARVTMRFFLPAKHAAHPPAPTDPRVTIVVVPARTAAALRYSGNPTDASRERHEKDLLDRLNGTSWRAVGKPYFLSYDPPFTIPFLKRNEIVVEIAPAS